MENYQKFIEQIKRHEGSIRNKDGHHVAYQCQAGFWTIGYGHNIEADPKVVIFELKTESPIILSLTKHSVIDEWEAEAILDHDIKRFEDGLCDNIPFLADLKEKDPVRHYVILNMAFNLGISTLLQFKKTIKYVKDGFYIEASSEMLNSKWANQVGPRAKELSRQMRTAQWQF